MIHKLLLAGLLLISTSDVHGINLDKVRWGTVSQHTEGQVISVINSKEVYKNISYYQTIIKEGVKQGTAKYAKLMRNATALYRSTLGKAGIPLIVEIGGVNTKLHKTEDVTKKIISLL
tara:strand:+ start:10598 stop:10951 length:354 start_codon:yes stop_codon:yes gene_type:complete